MVNIVIGERVGRDGRLGVGCSASIFDLSHEKVLLIRRADNGKWAVPGGYMEAGENFSEACQREVLEETGLSVRVRRLIGVYTSPNLLLEYPDGNKWQLVVLHFEAEAIDGELQRGDETADVAYFQYEQIESLDMNELDKRRVLDGFEKNDTAVVCDDFAFMEYRKNDNARGK